MYPSRNFLRISAVLCLASGIRGVDLKTCNASVQEQLNNGSISFQDPIFHFEGSEPMSKPGNLQLTIDGCRAQCPKADFDLYDDIWPRVLTWLIPALLLVGNIHIARVGTFNRFLAILHFIGDPVDSAWSLMAKAEVWNRFYGIAKRHTAPGPEAEAHARALAALLSAFEELTGDMTSVYQEFNSIINDQRHRLSTAELDHIMLEAAEELVDSRSNEVLRTALVILNYLWSVLSGLVPELGGPQSSTPGGRIGTAMFLSWLVTIVMLSNTLSGFVSRRTCLRIMERYFRTLKGRSRDQHYFPNSPLLGAKSGWRLRTTATNPSDFVSAQPWNGSLYSYRPNKHLVGVDGNDSTRSRLAILSMCPVVVAGVCALMILWFTPTVGLDCRGLWIVACTFALLASPILTWLIHKIGVGRFAWYLITAKDAMVGVSIIIVIVASSLGVFNTCDCWSSKFSLGRAAAYVMLNPEPTRQHNAHLIYPAMVAVCLGLQLVIYGYMYRIMRIGGKVFRPDEDEKMDTYRRVHGLDFASQQGQDIPLQATSPDYYQRPSSFSSEGAQLLLPPSVISPETSPRILPQAGSGQQSTLRGASPSQFLGLSHR